MSVKNSVKVGVVRQEKQREHVPDQGTAQLPPPWGSAR